MQWPDLCHVSTFEDGAMPPNRLSSNDSTSQVQRTVQAPWTDPVMINNIRGFRIESPDAQVGRLIAAERLVHARNRVVLLVDRQPFPSPTPCGCSPICTLEFGSRPRGSNRMLDTRCTAGGSCSKDYKVFQLEPRGGLLSISVWSARFCVLKVTCCCLLLRYIM